MTDEERKLRDAAAYIAPYLIWTISDESPGHHPTMPSAVALFLENFDLDTPLKRLEYFRNKTLSKDSGQQDLADANALLEAVKQRCLVADDEWIVVTEDPHIDLDLFDRICTHLNRFQVLDVGVNSNCVQPEYCKTNSPDDYHGTTDCGDCDRDVLLEACQAMADDYQTSEVHHPHHVLISRKEFEKMCAEISKANR